MSESPEEEQKNPAAGYGGGRTKDELPIEADVRGASADFVASGDCSGKNDKVAWHIKHRMGCFSQKAARSFSIARLTRRLKRIQFLPPCQRLAKWPLSMAECLMWQFPRA